MPSFRCRMSETPQRRLPVTPPAVPAPPLFSERRVRARRQSDVDAQTEIAFLARSLDVLAGVGSAEERLAALLELIAVSAGAERAAILADRSERRVAASVRPDENPRDAEALASWLDARAPRSRAERAASAPALVSLAMAAGVLPPSAPAADPAAVADPFGPDDDEAADFGCDIVETADMCEAGPSTAEPPTIDMATAGFRTDDGRYACITIPSSCTVVLGFDFGDAAAAEGWEA